MTLASLATLIALAAGAAPAASPAAAAKAPAKDPAALATVKNMADRVGSARTLQADLRLALELPTASGALATHYSRVTVSLRRPDGFAAKRTGELPDMRFAYDGKTMATYVAGTKKWGSAPAPGTLDAMLAAAGEQGSLSFPADELMVADPYAAMTKDLVEAVLVGKSIIGGKPAEHVLLVSTGVQLEYWIDETTYLPLREVVVYNDHPLRPHFTIDFTDWKLDVDLPTSTFALPKPAGAKDVGFRESSSAFR